MCRIERRAQISSSRFGIQPFQSFASRDWQFRRHSGALGLLRIDAINTYCNLVTSSQLCPLDSFSSFNPFSLGLGVSRSEYQAL
jgi:hypothetical protein